MFYKLVIASLIAGLTFGSQIASAQSENHCWTTVGSAGTVDEADLSLVALEANSTAVKSSVSVGTVDVRYNVVAVEGIFWGGGRSLTARMADNGAAAQVTVQLKQLNINTGVITSLEGLDSNDYPPSTVAQTRSRLDSCIPATAQFDFRNNIYYIEVALVKTGAGGNPLIRAIQICGEYCVD